MFCPRSSQVVWRNRAPPFGVRGVIMNPVAAGKGGSVDTISVIKWDTYAAVVEPLKYNGQILNPGNKVPYTGGEITPYHGTIKGIKIDGSTIIVSVN